MTAYQLLTDLQRQGINLRPLPDGKLEVRPASRLTEPLREELRRRKGEVLRLLTPQSASPRPYLNQRGELIIPFDSNPRYHYWAGGQSIAATMRELNAPPEVWRRYTDVPYGPVQ